MTSTSVIARIVRWPALAMLALCLPGCPPIYKATFCNATDEPLMVSVRSAGSTRHDPIGHSVEVPPGEQRPLPLEAWCQQVEVRDRSGNPIWHREVDYGRKGREDRRKPGYPTGHHLLTRTGVYVVPGEYIKSWRAHVDEIVRASLPLRPCTSDSYPYNIGLVPYTQPPRSPAREYR